jgi:hypothetical protein
MLQVSRLQNSNNLFTYRIENSHLDGFLDKTPLMMIMMIYKKVLTVSVVWGAGSLGGIQQKDVKIFYVQYPSQ